MRPLVAATAMVVALVPCAVRASDGLVSLRAPDADGRTFDLASERGQLVVLTFASRHVRDEAARVNQTIARSLGGTIEVVCVVDFMDIPGVGRGIAKKKMAEQETPRLHNLVDEKGELGRAFGADPRHRVDLFVVGRDGRLRGHFINTMGAALAVRRLAELRRAEQLDVARRARRGPRAAPR